jgi:RNA polymerase sigma factor (sigma-70 family)
MKRDTSELERVYRENRRGFLAWTAKATHNLVDAEDLVQDAFERALAKSEGLTVVDDLAAWLFASVRNRTRDFWRRRETRRKAGEIDVADETIVEIISEAGFDPAESLAAAELTEAVYDAIEELPDDQRMVIEAQVLDGMTFKELAESSGISPDTLAARKRYAVKKLSAALREWVGND